MIVIKDAERNLTQEKNSVEEAVRDILSNVKCQGDKAILDYTEKFDKLRLNGIAVAKEEIKAAYGKVST